MGGRVRRESSAKNRCSLKRQEKRPTGKMEEIKKVGYGVKGIAKKCKRINRNKNDSITTL